MRYTRDVWANLGGWLEVLHCFSGYVPVWYGYTVAAELGDTDQVKEEQNSIPITKVFKALISNVLKFESPSGKRNVK